MFCVYIYIYISVLQLAGRSEYIHLFYGVKSSLTSRQITWVINVVIVVIVGIVSLPWLVSEKTSKRLESEESEVAVCHVAVLGAE